MSDKITNTQDRPEEKPLTEQELQFCNLYVNGGLEYAGRPKKCFVEVFGEDTVKNPYASANYLMTDTQQTRLKTALDTPYYAGDYSQAAVDFFRQSDVVLAQTLGRSSTGGQSPAPGQTWQEPAGASGVSIAGVVLLIVCIFVVWAPGADGPRKWDSTPARPS